MEENNKFDTLQSNISIITAHSLLGMHDVFVKRLNAIPLY